MQLETFKRIVTTFADQDCEVIEDRGALLLQIRGILVEVEIYTEGGGDIKVVHDGREWTAKRWIYSYLAQLDRLADRIIDNVSPPEHYVSPTVNLLDWQNQPQKEYAHLDSTTRLIEILGKPPPAGVTSIYFLTSDAGEGKTSLIDRIAKDRAEAYKKEKKGALILPVPLGGRSFLRFDDAVIAFLSNRLRFSSLYYDSFLELMKMNVIIPAFDGYEEMLVQTKSGEAISAIGNLVDQLSSAGTFLVAARKAYFDSSLSAHSNLLDSVRSDRTVEIHRLALDRWDRKVFLEYADKRDIPEPEKLHDQVSKRLRKNTHPLLTRAVLVRRLMDVAEKENDLDNFLQRLGKSSTDYFSEFVENIIDREVKYKWIDKSGTDRPLLTRDEHHQLLSQLAFEMWIDSVDSLGPDVVKLIVEFFTKEKNKTPTVLRQILNRINDHSLLRLDNHSGIDRIQFDHEDFQEFYLGQALGRFLDTHDHSYSRFILDAGSLAKPVIEETLRYLQRDTPSKSTRGLLDNLLELSRGHQQVSYVRENCGALVLELAQNLEGDYTITDVDFPANALEQRKLHKLEISDSFFNPTNLSQARITDCRFTNCRFARLVIDGTHSLDRTIFDNCIFDSVMMGNESEGNQRVFFDRDKVHAVLRNQSIILESEKSVTSEEADPMEMDDDMKTALRFIRMFNRATAIPEKVVSTRMGTKYSYFDRRILPELQDANLVTRLGGSHSARLRLTVRLSHIDKLVENSGGEFKRFIEKVSG